MLYSCRWWAATTMVCYRTSGWEATHVCYAMGHGAHCALESNTLSESGTRVVKIIGCLVFSLEGTWGDSLSCPTETKGTEMRLRLGFYRMEKHQGWWSFKWASAQLQLGARKTSSPCGQNVRGPSGVSFQPLTKKVAMFKPGWFLGESK